jgi:hypothetical protein
MKGMLSGGMLCFRGRSLVAQHQDVAHGQHVPFGRVLNFPRASIRTHQPERAFLFSPLLQGLPKLRNLRLEAGLRKVVDRAADDLLPRQP